MVGPGARQHCQYKDAGLVVAGNGRQRCLYDALYEDAAFFGAGNKSAVGASSKSEINPGLGR
jgi:hypothetical protein